MSNLLEGLNDIQTGAVLHDRGPLLILAGAGSGKTRVLTHRIAYLIGERGVSPYSIIALTFTNKAAGEMKERVEKLVGTGSENIWVSTFHSSCVRILRRFIDTIGYQRDFTIYDADDQKTLMKEVCKYLNIDTKNLKEKTILGVISSAKDELISPEEFAKEAGNDKRQKTYADCYAEYQKRLKSNNALDFDDLIYKTVELFDVNKEALSYYQRRFQYILVDEYQDTNSAQFKLISMLANHVNEYGETEHNLCVVGDDDQSIYKFRGANIRNILDFEKSYPEAVVIRLEQNYRSTKNILEVANEVIHNNRGRKQKRLWTENEQGVSVELHCYPNDNDEATGVVSEIASTVREGFLEYRDFAVLYRTNAQSRSFEEKLIYRNIPYKIIGGQNFYQRKEIKDMLAYLRTIDSGTDSIAVKRIINTPKRGIGLATLERIQAYTEEHDISFYDALKAARFIPGVERAASKLEKFVALIEMLRDKLRDGLRLRDMIDEILEATQYIDYLAEDDEQEKVEERIDNINELVSKLADYEEGFEGTNELPSLKGFLDEVSLVADIDNLNEDNNVVVLMTIHSAKGLEFPYVFLVGMEEGVFPGYMSINADNPEEEIEEERRLCYVGMTRAKEKLVLSCCKQRMTRGEIQYNKQSRFLDEIPRHLLKISGSQGSGRMANDDNLRRRYGDKASEDNFRSDDNFGGRNNSGGRSGFGGDFFSADGSFNLWGFAADTDADGAGRAGSGNSDSKNSASLGKNNGKTGASGSSFGNYKPVGADSRTNSIGGSRNFGSGPAGTLEYGIGDRVSHVKFGTGTVIDIVRGGRDYEVTVEFPCGVKKMLAAFAKLTKV